MIDLSGIKKIHCIGIGGIGLSAIADILLANGFEVSGSDMKASDITERLQRDGATVYIGHARENVRGCDLIVYSAAVGSDNPEMLEAKEKGIPVCSRARMLGHLMEECKTSIAVAGTHGKTTTTSMVALMLRNAKKEPTLLVGGHLAELNGNVEVGKKDLFLTEACEYMDSFLELRPTVEIILNIDSDHLDYFRDIEHIVDSFQKFIGLVPDSGLIIAYDANPFVNSAIRGLDNVVTFGLNKHCDYSAQNIVFDPLGLPSYELWHDGKKIDEIKLCIPGEYNILNSLAAIACCHELGVSVDVARETLKHYGGTQRRFTLVGEMKNGARIIDDYAHHPTEIKAMLSAAKNMRHRDIWCIFQPHTYTRTIALFEEFGVAFEEADKIILAEIYPAREKNVKNISSSQLVPEIAGNNPGKEVKFFDTFDEIVKYVYEHCKPEDLIITTGAGDINVIGEMLLEKEKVIYEG